MNYLEKRIDELNFNQINEIISELASNIIITTPAKLNIGLNIGKIVNGYHELNSFYAKISLYDSMEIWPVQGDDVVIDGLKVENNIISKAFNEVKEYLPNNLAFLIVINKNIPISSGLGGGSSNAYGFLCGINKYFISKIAKFDKILLNIGQDCLYFNKGGICIQNGLNNFKTIESDLINKPVLLLTPNQSNSTAEAFKAFDNLSIKPKQTDILFKYEYLKGRISNSFDYITQNNSDVQLDIINCLSDENVHCYGITGSGPTIYAIDDDVNKLIKIKNKLIRNIKFGTITRIIK